MKMQFILPALAVAGAAVLSSLFIVTETEKALVLQFGQVKQVKENPGLGFKIPLIQEVVYYDDRILVCRPSRSKSPPWTTVALWSTPLPAGGSAN